MKFEPPFSHAALIDFLHEAYGITAQRLTFMPMGMVACSYLVDGDEGRRWFLKLLGRSRLAKITRGRLGFFLPVCEKLAALGHAVPRAIRTRTGALTGRFEDWETVLAPFLSGPVVMNLPTRPPALSARLGSAVGAIHRDTPLLGLDAFKTPPVERWSPHWRSALLAGLARAARDPAPWPRAGQKRLRDLLLEKQGRILSTLARMDELGRMQQAANPPLVLVNTDLNDSNLIEGDDGRLWLLDWEGALLAPAEGDLFIFWGQGFEEMLRAYGQAFRLDHLSAEGFGYQFYRRNLEDLTDWVVTIFDENTLDEEDEGDLEGIRRDCMDGWPHLERAIESIRAVLA